MTDQPMLVRSADVLTESAASALVAAATRHAVQHAFTASVVVVDGAGLPLASARMDGARPVTLDLAGDKAWTAASLGLPTRFLSERLDNPKVAAIASRPRVVALPGGVPLVVKGRVVGAIGVSGGSDDQDVAAAIAALSLVGFDPG